MNKQLPERIGKYIIKSLLGKGGMGRVYHAYDPIIGRDVALKVMLSDLAEDRHLKERFIREAQSAGRLRHPHIVTIYDLGEENGIPYIAMEYLEGTDLDKYIRQNLPLTLEEKLEIIRQAAEALAYAHRKGIVHRDIKPANIRLLDNKTVKIMDFGIAKMGATHFTQTGIIMGTPHYMAPEQIRDFRDKIDGRADIFALGVVLYELLCGKRPFDGEHYTTVFYKIVHEPPAPLDPSICSEIPELVDVINRALAKDPDERYATADELAQDLKKILDRLRGTTPTRQTRAVPEPTEQPTVITPPPTSVSTGTAQTGVDALPTAVTTSPAAGMDASPATPSPTALTIQQVETRPRKRWGLMLGAGAGLGALLLLAFFIFMSKPGPKPVPPGSTVNPSPSQTSPPAQSSPRSSMPTTDKPSPNPTTPKPSPETSPRSTEPPSPKPTGPPTPAVAPPQPGYVQIDIHPWARIDAIRNVKTGAPVKLNGNEITPTLITLPPGEYEITLSHPRAREPMVKQFVVYEGQTTRLTGRFQEFAWPRLQQSRLRPRRYPRLRGRPS